MTIAKERMVEIQTVGKIVTVSKHGGRKEYATVDSRMQSIESLGDVRHG